MSPSCHPVPKIRCHTQFTVNFHTAISITQLIKISLRNFRKKKTFHSIIKKAEKEYSKFNQLCSRKKEKEKLHFSLLSLSLIPLTAAVQSSITVKKWRS